MAQYKLNRSIISLIAFTTASIAPLKSYAVDRQFDVNSYSRGDLSDNASWRNGIPNNNDNIIFQRSSQYLMIDRDINLGDISLQNFKDNRVYINNQNSVSINNILSNKQNAIEIILETNPLGGSSGNLTINGNQIQGVDHFFLAGGAKLQFNGNLTVNSKIKTRGNYQGALVINNNITFNAPIGTYNNRGVSYVNIEGNKSATFKNSLRGYDFVLEDGSQAIFNSQDRGLDVYSNIANNTSGEQEDDKGSLVVTANNVNNNAVNFHGDIGSEDVRIGDITVQDGLGNVTFNNSIKAKKITIGDRPVTFGDTIDLFKREEVIAFPRPDRNTLNILDRGALEFGANRTIKLKNDFYGDITATGNNMGKIEVEDKINFAGTVSNKLAGFHFTGDNTLISQGAIFNKKLTTENDGEGKLHIEGNTEILAGIGENLKKFDEIKFLGDYTLLLSENDINVKNIITDKDSDGTVILKGNNRIINNALNNMIGTPLAKLKAIAVADNGVTLRVSDANINAASLQLLRNDQTLIVDDNISFAGHIKGNGKVRFAGRSNVNWLGENGAKLAEIKAGSQNINFNRAIYANILDCERGGDIRINHRTLNVNQVLLRDGANINFVNGLESPVTIKAENASNGNVTFSAGGKVGAIGEANKPVGNLIFANDGNQTLYDNIYADNINFDNGAFTANNANLIITANVFNLVPNGWTQENNKLYVTRNPVRANSINPAAVAGTNSAIEVANDTQAGLEIQTLGVDSQNSMSAIDSALIRLNQIDLLANPTVRNAEKKENNIVKITAEKIIENSKDIIENINKLSASGIKFDEEVQIEALSDSTVAALPKTNQAIMYIASINSLSPEERQQSQTKVEKSTKQPTTVIKGINKLIETSIDNRISYFNTNSSTVGVASGDSYTDIIKGVWISGIYGNDTQKNSKNHPGYKGASAGGIIGIDFDINDSTLLGVGYSHIISNIKFKNDLLGNKLNATSHIAMLYGKHLVNDHLSLQATLSVSKNQIATKRSVALNVVNKKTASGKLKNTSYSAAVSTHYKINLDNNLLLIPNIGIKYNSYKDGSLKETGAGVHNLSIQGKNSSDLNAKIGAKIELQNQAFSGLNIVPSLHASLEQNLFRKKEKVKAKLIWMDDYFVNQSGEEKSDNTIVDIGGAVFAKHQNVELEIGYNCHLKTKYIGHQGSLKLRLLF